MSQFRILSFPTFKILVIHGIMIYTENVGDKENQDFPPNPEFFFRKIIRPKLIRFGNMLLFKLIALCISLNLIN